MLVVRIELHSAITGKITEIGRMVIANQGNQPDPEIGDYCEVVGRKPSFTSTVRKGEILNHKRLKEPVWNLVGKMLKVMGYVT